MPVIPVVPIMPVPDVSVPVVIIEPVVSVVVAAVLVVIEPVVSVDMVLVLAEVSVIVVVLVSVLLVVDSCLHAKPNSATAAMVRKTRIVFFIFIPFISLFKIERPAARGASRNLVLLGGRGAGGARHACGTSHARSADCSRG